MDKGDFSRIITRLIVGTETGKYLLYSLFLVFMPLPSAESGQAIRFEHISVEQGLSQATITCILQDGMGFMWFGTGSGLNRYDGYKITAFRHDPEKPGSLSSNRVSCMMEDQEGMLWVGTRNSGINRFDPRKETFRHFRHQPDDIRSLSNDNVSALYESGNGDIWVGTENGLDRFDIKSGRFNHYRHDTDNPESLSDNRIIVIRGNKNGLLWVGTRRGLNRFDPDTGRCERFMHDPNNPESPPDDFIQSLYIDQSDVLWIGTEKGGLSGYDPSTSGFKHYRNDPNDPESLPENDVTAILEDRSKNLWIGTSINGLNRIDRAAHRIHGYMPEPNNPHSISSISITCLYEDAGGEIWVGTGLDGISRFDPFFHKFRIFQNDPNDFGSLDSNHVNALLEDQAGNLWIGTASGRGLNKLAPDRENFVHYGPEKGNPNSLINRGVAAILEDRFGKLWIGTWGGLDRFDPETGEFDHYQHHPDDPYSMSPTLALSLFEDDDGVLWIGTYGSGLSRFERDSGRFIHYRHDPDAADTLSSNFVKCMFEDSRRTLWIGTDRGLNTFDLQKQTFTRYRSDLYDSRYIKGILVAAIHESGTGTLWFGTELGLNKFDRATGTFKRYGKAHGLRNEEICGILEDGRGNLWISTGNGLALFDPQTERFRMYDTGDGLPGSEFNSGVYLKTRDGIMLFGGPNGLSMFHPDRVRDNPYIPPVVITDFLLFNESVDPGNDSPLKKSVFHTDAISLTHKDYVFSFEFAALSYARPENNQYAYLLEGFENRWNLSGIRRFATYTDLPAGNYIFRVKGANHDGVWNETGASIRISVSPPPWKTWWAYTLYVLILAGSVYAYVRNLKKKFQEERRGAEQMRRMEEQLHQARKMESLGKLAGGIAHDFNNVLASITGFTQFALDKELSPDNPARDSLEEILKASGRARDIVKGILTFSRKTDEERIPVRLSDIIADNLKFLRASLPNTIEIHQDIRAESDYVLASPSQMAQVLMNLCTNAEYAMRGGSGKLSIILDREDINPDTEGVHQGLEPGEYLKLVVSDAGAGITDHQFQIVFEPYFTTKPAGEGTGFGLSVIHGIITGHGGRVTVASQVGKGTSFEILLPAIEGKEAVSGLDDAPLPGGHERILFIDDEQQIVKACWKLLTSLGYNVTGATDSIRAFRTFKEDPNAFDIIVTDFTMPRMTGVDLAQRVLNIRPDMPIILCTGYAGIITREKAIAMGIREMLEKPVDNRRLVEIIRRVLDETKS